MTVLSRGARVRRGGRRPGWVLLTTLLVLAIGASSALVFTNRVELLKLAVVLALWAAVAGAFVSVLYRRQAEADQARARDMKLVYDLQLDREISARREYELAVESQLRRELAAELRGAAADEVAALRAELASLRTSLGILFDADLEQRPALETVDRESRTARAVADRLQNGESPATDWLPSDRIAMARRDENLNRAEEAIIDVPEVGVPPLDERDVQPGRGPFLQPPPPAPRGPEHPAEWVGPPQEAAPVQPDLHYEPHRRPPPAPPVPNAEPSPWRPVAADGQWLPPGAPGSHWVAEEAAGAETQDRSSGRRRRARHYGSDEDQGDIGEFDREYGGRRSRSRHSTDYRDYGVGRLGAGPPPGPGPAQPPPMAPAAPPWPGPQPAEPAAPRLAPPPAPDLASRHRRPEEERPDVAGSHDSDSQSGGQSVADLMARLQVQPSGGGRRRRRDG